jgi:glycine betaine/proline transport system substrate-binding protein
MKMFPRLKAALVGSMFAAGAGMMVFPVEALADEHLPGDGKTVRMARASWDTGWFQTEIYLQALEKLGYDVEGPTTLDNPPFYLAVGQGDMDLWVNGWFPLHNTYEDDFQPGAMKIGYVAKGGALQGYLIDKKTADAHNITMLEDFKKEEIRELFDNTGDGKADLVACPPGWGCEKVIAHQIEAYGLSDSVQPVKAAYSASMADAVGRYENGGSIFFYTWTPNWTVGILKPGTDVVWLQVSEPNLPEDQKNLEGSTTFPGVVGCASDPCKLGWPVSDIRPVANVEFLNENPAVKTLLEEMTIPIEDIFTQNAKMQAGEDKKQDLERHAAEWIAANQTTFDGWIALAVAAGK